MIQSPIIAFFFFFVTTCLVSIHIYIYIIMAEIAHHHGGDGGSDPLPDPSRIPSQCESGIIIYNFWY